MSEQIGNALLLGLLGGGTVGAVGTMLAMESEFLRHPTLWMAKRRRTKRLDARTAELMDRGMDYDEAQRTANHELHAEGQRTTNTLRAEGIEP